MSKLAVLEIQDGDFESGFVVTLTIAEDGCYPSFDARGSLPQAKSEVFDCYISWQTSYRCRVPHPRIEKGKEPPNPKILDILEDIIQKSDCLKKNLNQWLKSPEFGSIREGLKQELSKSEEIRVIIRTDLIELQQLPWHLWDVFDHYPYANVALSPRTYISVPQPELSTTKERIKLLATFGKKQEYGDEINTNKDWNLLQQHLDRVAYLVPLVEPKLKELSTHLRKENPDIFFYAGHSSTLPNGQTGEIDSIKIRNLKYAFREAVANGLKLAIFNSCEGLGIARELADSHIPQIIVMSEPIPDEVAHDFLEHFIKEFARGTSLYLALRKARERLHDLEDEYPSAAWLPIIFQNSTEVPPNWKEFQQSLSRNSTQSEVPQESSATDQTQQPPHQSWISRNFWRICTGVAGLIILAGVSSVARTVQRNRQTINQIAKNNTVLIEGRNPGSGFIFAKKGKTYYVLTTKSVVDANTKDKYNLVTSDTNKHPVVVSDIGKKLFEVDLDLAILQFNSNTDYNIARLGNSDKAIEGTAVYISGWSGIDGSDAPSYNFIEGKISSLNKVLPNGYTLIYNSNIREGMKGGSLLDKDGCVIGIHGRAEQEALRNLESAQIGLVKNGFNQGIPIKTFLERVSEPEIEKQLGQMEHCH